MVNWFTTVQSFQQNHIIWTYNFNGKFKAKKMRILIISTDMPFEFERLHRFRRHSHIRWQRKSRGQSPQAVCVCVDYIMEIHAFHLNSLCSHVGKPSDLFLYARGENKKYYISESTSINTIKKENAFFLCWAAFQRISGTR